MRRRLTIMVVVGLLLLPVAVWAADGFTDVPDSNVFHDDIGWLADTGVTRGCNPPDNTQFCPDDDVTRGQMAAFMRRLAEGRVVEASDSDTLGGEAPAQYQTVSAIGVCDDISQTIDPESALEPCPDPTNSGAVLAELTLEAPADGYLLLDWDATVEGGAALTVGYLTADPDLGCANYSDEIPGSIASTNLVVGDITIGGNGRHPVSAGATTIYLCGWSSSTTPVTFASVTALWTAG